MCSCSQSQDLALGLRPGQNRKPSFAGNKFTLTTHEPVLISFWEPRVALDTEAEQLLAQPPPCLWAAQDHLPCKVWGVPLSQAGVALHARRQSSCCQR